MESHLFCGELLIDQGGKQEAGGRGEHPINGQINSGRHSGLRFQLDRFREPMSTPRPPPSCVLSALCSITPQNAADVACADEDCRR